MWIFLVVQAPSLQADDGDPRSAGCQPATDVNQQQRNVAGWQPALRSYSRYHNHNVSEYHSPHRPPQQFSRGWVVLPLVLLVLAIVVMQGPRVSQTSPAIGKPSPQIDIMRLSSEPGFERIENLNAGEVTLVHFWGTWCGPCKMEYPELAEMAGRLSDEPGFRFLPISCEGDSSETFEGLTEKTFAYFRSANIESPAYADPRGITRRSAAERLEQTAMYYPTSILVAPDGKIAAVWEGYAPESVAEMESRIKSLLP